MFGGRKKRILMSGGRLFSNALSERRKEYCTMEVQNRELECWKDGVRILEGWS